MTFYNLEKNIASKVGNFSKGEYIKKVNFWSYDEFLQFIKVVDDDIVYYTFFIVLYFSGMHLGEILALNWNDLTNDYLNIEKSLLKNANNGEYITNVPKTSSSIRKIKLDRFSIDTLNRLKRHYQSYVGFSEEWFIFGGIKPLSRITIARKKNEYCELAQIKKIRLHDFRHSHATLLFSKGVPITVVSKRLGHSNTTMTLNIYSHSVPEDEDKSVDLFNKMNKEKMKAREF